MMYLAKPVWFPEKEGQWNVYGVFQQKLMLPVGAKLYITAADFYQAWVNDRFLSFGPGRAALGYARVDVLELPAGDVDLVIQICGYNCKSLSTVHQPPFLMAEIRSGEEVLVWTGHDFTGFLPPCKVQKCERYSRQRHFTEIWDFRDFHGLTDPRYLARTAVTDRKLQLLSRRAPAPRYRDIRLEAAHCRGTLAFDETLPYKQEKYSHQRLPEDWGAWPYEQIPYHPMVWIQRQRQTVTQRSCSLPLMLEAGAYVLLDFGRVEVGFLRTALRALEKSDVILAFNEYQEGEIFTLARMNTHNVLQYLLPAGEARQIQSFEPYACRFCILAVRSGRVELSDFGLQTLEFGGDLPALSGGTPAQQEIYQAALRTFAHNTVDIYMDCPSRERAGWLCDSYFTAKVEYALTGRSLVEADFLENFRCYRNSGNLPQGALPMCYPADMETDMPHATFIPQWTLWYILQACEFIRDRGHWDQKEDFRGSIYGLLDFFAQYENQDGLLERLPGWNFVEWSEANNWTWDVNYPTNFLYAGALEAVAEVFEDGLCDQKSRHVRRTAAGQAFRGGWFHDHAVRNAEGILELRDHASEAGQYYALLFGHIDLFAPQYGSLRRLVLEVFRPVRTQEVPQIFPVNAFIGAYLRMEVLMRLNQDSILLEDVEGFFGNMARYTGTLWENQGTNGSLDHGFASYAAVVLRKALGNPQIKNILE